MDHYFASEEKILDLKKRHRRGQYLKFFGLSSVVICCSVLVLLIIGLIWNGYRAFQSSYICLPISFSKEIFDPKKVNDDPGHIDFSELIHEGLDRIFSKHAIEPSMKRELYRMISLEAIHQLRNYVAKNPEVVGSQKRIWLLASSEVDHWMKGKDFFFLEKGIEQQQWMEFLKETKSLKLTWSFRILWGKDSRDPEKSGMSGSIIGSLLTIGICFLFAFPLGVLCAVYLEECAKKSLLNYLIETSIYNLASVPSIVFGLLGFAIFLNTLHMERSVSLVGGGTLGLMIIPIIVITTRNALRTVPLSIKTAAMALGASPMQVIRHHTLPLALPGIMTGSILSISRVLGETAPLLMIGMVAFIVDIPKSIFDPATVMPVQIYLWARSPEPGFIERTSAAIFILLFILTFLNAIAMVIRKKFEQKW